MEASPPVASPLIDEQAVALEVAPEAEAEADDAELAEVEAELELALEYARGNSPAPHPRSRFVTLHDGRTAHTRCYGADPADACAPAAICFPPLAGTHTYGACFDAAARTRGLRVFCVDRAGFGLSSPLPPRDAAKATQSRLDTVARDAREIARALDLPEHYALIGHSAGGLDAGACAAAELQQRAPPGGGDDDDAADDATPRPRRRPIALALVAPWAPLRTEGFQWYCSLGSTLGLRCCAPSLARCQHACLRLALRLCFEVETTRRTRMASLPH